MLNPKHRVFAQEYLIDLNATQAAIRAGYSAKTAYAIGEKLLKRPDISAAVQEGMDKRSQETAVTAERVLKETARLAFSDIRQLFDENGHLRPLHQLTDDAAAAIASFEIVTRRIPGSDPVEVEHVAKIKVWDKTANLNLLGKHLKLFSDQLNITGNLTIDQILENVKAGPLVADGH